MNYKIITKDGEAVSFFQYLIDSQGFLPDAVLDFEGQFIDMKDIKFEKFGSVHESLTPFIGGSHNGKVVRLDLCFAAEKI